MTIYWQFTFSFDLQIADNKEKFSKGNFITSNKTNSKINQLQKGRFFTNARNLPEKIFTCLYQEKVLFNKFFEIWKFEIIIFQHTTYGCSPPAVANTNLQRKKEKNFEERPGKLIFTWEFLELYLGLNLNMNIL